MAQQSESMSIKDPVCGMEVNQETASYRHVHDDRSYVFCSAGCLEKFRSEPNNYLGSSEPSAAAATVKDPVCGMSVDPATGKHHCGHGGKTYYFCSDGCLRKFQADLYAAVAN